jgi:hypothetical protein
MLATGFALVSCLAYSLTQKTEATSSSEISVDFQQTTQCYIPDAVTTLNPTNFIMFNPREKS